MNNQSEDGRLALPGSNTSHHNKNCRETSRAVTKWLFKKRSKYSREKRVNTLPCLWLCRVPIRANMDEYDELFEIQDDFEDQFADELEAMADMEGEKLTSANKL